MRSFHFHSRELPDYLLRTSFVKTRGWRRKKEFLQLMCGYWISNFFACGWGTWSSDSNQWKRTTFDGKQCYFTFFFYSFLHFLFLSSGLPLLCYKHHEYLSQVFHNNFIKISKYQLKRINWWWKLSRVKPLDTTL